MALPTTVNGDPLNWGIFTEMKTPGTVVPSSALTARLSLAPHVDEPSTAPAVYVIAPLAGSWLVEIATSSRTSAMTVSVSGVAVAGLDVCAGALPAAAYAIVPERLVTTVPDAAPPVAGKAYTTFTAIDAPAGTGTADNAALSAATFAYAVASYA